MPPKAGYSTPMLHVADVIRSIRFYQLLGFDLIDTEGPASCLGWARMHCEGGAVMFLLAEKPVDASIQSVLLALYTPDLPALREHLLANGVKVPPITYPDYMPSGQITFRDPDGYIVGINHWGDAEHDTWLKSIEQNKKSGSLPSSEWSIEMVKKKTGRVFSSWALPGSTDLPTSTQPHRATMPGRSTESTKSAVSDFIPTGFPALSR